MKTIDKVRVFSLEGLLDAFSDKNKLEHTRETEILFENEIKGKGLVIDSDGDYIIGYGADADVVFGYESESYIEKIQYWQECNEVKINTPYDSYGSISISWEIIYDELKQHEHLTDTYFKPEEVEKLVSGDLSFSKFTDSIVNQFAIDYIKAFVLESIKDKINSMTADNLEWE